ncbi:MAG: tetratricopeptide repeat protein [Actinomycetota bacterium]
MTLTDQRGSEMTTGDQAEVDAFDNALELFLNYERSAGGAVKALLTDHPDTVMGTVLRGYMLMMLESGGVYPKVDAMVAEIIADDRDTNRRERLHLDALRHWANADVLAAATVWDHILAADPRDVLALKMHHYTTFWTGRADVLRSTVEGVVDTWDPATPGYDHVLGMLAFALNESGRHEQAEEIGREAVAANPEDLWSIHAVAHALEMQGANERGDRFFQVDDDRWGSKNPFLGHIWWHAALFPWNSGDYDRVLDLYDNRLRPASTEFYLDIQNLSSLLTRLELSGVDVGDRWGELADHAAARTGDHVLTFTDVHCALTLARTDRIEELGAFVESLERHQQDDGGRTPGLPIAIQVSRALAAAAGGDHRTGAELLGAVRGDLAPIGGSHAQRDLFDLVLADMTLTAGEVELALHQLRARTRRWPNSVPTWQRYGQALVAAGRSDDAAEAFETAATLRGAEAT